MSAFFIHTFGCQMNEYDSDRLAHALLSAGWQRVGRAEDADLLLANTCTVRQLAEDKAFSLLGRWRELKEQRPGVLIGLVGCLAQQLAEEAFRREPSIDFLAGPRALTRVPELAAAARRDKRLAARDEAPYGEGAGADARPGEISAQVAVMEGCEQFCSYCAVPFARGRETSRPVPAILAEVLTRVQHGVREIVLLGQNVNRYGLDLAPAEDFSGLLPQVAAVPGVVRLRFMTSHPRDFPPRLLSAFTELPQLCEALHLPLQSGSDRILSAMNRGYTAADYRGLVERLRARVPNLALSTDLIVGFPGETEADFQGTLEMFRDCGFENAYCFKYSPRRETPAAGLPEQVPQPVKEERLTRLLEVVRRQATGLYAGLVGHCEPVLVERVDPGPPTRLRGRTRTNRWVAFPGPADLLGREVKVRITAAHAWSLLGELEQ